jgi:hypothetical protein
MVVQWAFRAVGAKSTPEVAHAAAGERCFGRNGIVDAAHQLGAPRLARVGFRGVPGALDLVGDQEVERLETVG